MVHACLVQWSLPRVGECDGSAFYVLYQKPGHCLDAVRGVEQGVHAQDSPFPLAICKELACVFPLCKVGQRAVEHEVSLLCLLCLLVVAEIFLYVLAIVA